VSVAMLTALVTLAGFGLTYACVRGVVLLMARSDHDGDGRLFARGVAPTGIAAALALFVVLPAFILFEPPHDGERVGLLVTLAAAFGAWHVGRVVARALRMLRVSRALTEEWASRSTPVSSSPWGLPAFVVDADFPIVAVAGLVRPRLYVDRRVLAACSTDEIDAIAAHERAHVVHRDNMRRLIIAACEGSSSIAATAWRQAAEHAADARAADSSRRALDLASALLKLARLTPGPSLERAAVSTVHDGGSLETRVRLLLDGRPAVAAPAPPSGPRMLAFGLAAATIVSVPGVLGSVHRLAEALIRLP
jgi:Zn-dependent protease with chaperone function